MRQALEAGAGGLTAVFDHMGKSAELTTDKLARMGAVGYSMFQALRAQGYGTLEAMKLLGPAIEAAAKAALDAGLELTGSFKELADFQKRLGENEGLIKAIDGATAALNALAVAGHLSEADFNTMQAAATGYFEELMAAGFTAEQALQIMAPMLYGIAQAAERYGFAVDEALQAQIDLAEESGLFEDMQSPMDKIVTALENMGLLLAELAKFYGLTLPAELDKYYAKLREHPALPSVPGGPGTPGGGGGPEEPDPSRGYRPEGMATGGMVRARPGGTIVRLGEGGEDELVLPKSKLGMLGGSADLAAAIRELASRPIVVEIDGREVAIATAVQMERGTDGGRRMERATMRAGGRA